MVGTTETLTIRSSTILTRLAALPLLVIVAWSAAGALAQEGAATPGGSDAPELVRGDDGCWVDPATGDVAYCEDEIEDVLVLGEDGCWHHPDGALAYCEAVEEPEAEDPLIPGEDGCFYYSDGGLAECPEGTTPTDGGCTLPADGSAGCVIPGPVAGEAEEPVGGDPVVDEEPIQEIENPVVAPPPAPSQGQSDMVGVQPDASHIAETAAPAFDPSLAAVRVGQAIASLGGWLSSWLIWLFGLV